MLPTIRLNGKVFTRASTAIRLNGVFRLNGVESAEWSDELPHELVSAMNEGGLPLGKGEGNYTCSASISLYLDECAAFESAVMATSVPPATPFKLSSANFQISIITREEARVRPVILANCNIVGKSDSVSADGSARVKQYTLQPTVVIENGLALVRLTPAL
jgi:hypothetical protein